MKNILFASDLDNTLLYSYKYKKKGDICVEFNKGKEQGFMTQKMIKFISFINKKLLFIPITTRSIEQYLRIKWPNGCEPEYAVVSNGANLLYKGNVDKKWQNKVFDSISKQYKIELYEQYEIQSKMSSYIRCRIVDDVYLFVYCKDYIDIQKQAILCQNKTKLKVIASGKKIYFFPPQIDKGIALGLLKEQFRITKIIAAGDSIIDIPMFGLANCSFTMEKIKDKFFNKNVFYCNDSSLDEFILNKMMYNFYDFI